MSGSGRVGRTARNEPSQGASARLLLAVAPAAAASLGVVQLVGADGFASVLDLLGWSLVLVGYLVTLVAVLERPWPADSWQIPAVCLAASASAPLFGAFLREPRPSVVWFWMCGPVVTLGAYLCPPPTAVGVGLGVSAVATYMAVGDGVSAPGPGWLVLCGLLANAVPGVGTGLVLGRARRRELQVLAQAGRDPVTGLLNRRGLEHALVRRRRERPEDELALVSLHLDGVEASSGSWSVEVAADELRAAARAVGEAYEGTHVVGRLVDDELVVISEIDPELLVPSLLRAARAVMPHRERSAVAGVVAGVPAAALTVERLVPVLELAREMLPAARTSPFGMAVRRYDLRDQPAPRARAAVQALGAPSGAGRDRSWLEVEGRVLGWWLVAAAILMAAAPRAAGWPVALSVTCFVACLVVGVGGAWLALQVSHSVRLAELLVLLEAVTAPVILAGAASAPERYLLLHLVAYAPVMAGMLLPPRWTGVLLGLFVPGTVVALAVGPHPSPWPGWVLGLALVIPGVAAVCCLLLRERSRAVLAQLHALTLTDPTTGVLTRQGLARGRTELADAGRGAVALVSVRAVAAGRSAVPERDVLAVASALHEVARSEGGLVGRLGGGELALVLPGEGAPGELSDRLEGVLAAQAPRTRAVVAVVRDDEGGEAGLWRALDRADAVLRARREVGSTLGRGPGEPHRASSR